MPTTNPLATLLGKIAKPLLPKRGQQQKLRFLCPNCLHFGDFAFACGECWSELPGYANGKNTQTCPRCQRSLLSADGDGVRAYCKQCKANCDRSIHHHRQVRVLATLRFADFQSLYRSISGQEYRRQGGWGYAYDDGVQLAYVLILGDFTDKAYSLPRTHALWEVESIWLDMSASNPKKLALELAEAADRLAKLTEVQQRALTVCIHQAEADPVVKHVMETRFGKVSHGVWVTDFLSEGEPTKLVALDEVGHGIPVPALLAALKHSDWDVREKVVAALGKIGKPAVPALSWALKHSDVSVRRNAATALGKIGDVAAVPALSEALKHSDVSVRRDAATALGKIGKPAVPVLSEALKDREVYAAVATALIKIGEAETLVKIGKPAVPALIVALKEKDPYVRWGATWALGEIGDDFAVPALIAALNDNYSEVHRGAAEALGKIRATSAVPALEAADRKYHTNPSCEFCDALRRLGAK